MVTLERKKKAKPVSKNHSEKERKTRTLNPILVNFSESTKSRPSNTNAGLFMPAYTFSQLISLNSFHSVAMTTASASSHASIAELHILTCFLTERNVLVSETNRIKTFKRTGIQGYERASFREVKPNLISWDLRIVNIDECFLALKVLDQGDCSWLASISGISLECKPEDGNSLENIVNYSVALKWISITLPVIVLKRVSTTLLENRLFWYSFISTTCLQYAATSGRCKLSLR